MNIKSVYLNSDGRTRAYYVDDNNIPHVVSYPRLILEQKLGRKLNSNEDVHHIDGNPSNNDESNLEVIEHGLHQKLHSTKYYDKEEICQVCQNKFIWTSKQQRRYYSDIKSGKNRIISCSKKCSSYYGRMVQLNKIS